MTPIWTPCPICGEPLAATDHDGGCPHQADDHDLMSEDAWDRLAQEVDAEDFGPETEIDL